MMFNFKAKQKTIAVIGLGYVGLPIAVEFGKIFNVVGFDLKLERIEQLRTGIDLTGEISVEELGKASYLRFTQNPEELASAEIFIVTVPTPVDLAHRPDLQPLIRASTMIGRCLKKGDLVIYESTVYPGCTEEVCVPILEKMSGLQFNIDFTCGYSPERINPGDKINTLTNIKKVTSGSTAEAAKEVDALYSQIIVAGTFLASSIKVAEAAKAIENTQRDLNIALMNELALIFDRFGIDTLEVLQAAGTKWNFLPFRPGLVGGHCIGVDPYYLTYKAEMSGYHPQVILAGRRINDGMAAWIGQQTVKQMIQNSIPVKGAKVIVLGLTFKEDCPDLRNSKVVDLIKELQSFGCDVIVHDPMAQSDEAEKEYGIQLTPWDDLPTAADVIIAAVAHRNYVEMPLPTILGKLRKGGVFTDVKSAFNPTEIRENGAILWRI